MAVNFSSAETKTTTIKQLGTVATRDQWGNIVNTNPTYATIEAVFSHLTSQEKIARTQLQDDSKYKLYVENNSINQGITHEMSAEIGGVKYRINGTPKVSPLRHGRITIYITED